jgi:ketosteroid isomerase-like protein
MNRILVSLSAALLACGIAVAQAPSFSVAGPVSPTATEQGVTTTTSPEVAQFQKIENSWSDAVNRRDQYGLELVLSPLFVDVSAQGDVTTRNQQVALVLSGQDKSLYLTQKIVTVRMLGDIAVVNGTYTLHHKVNGAETDEKGIFTHVFERVHGEWVCVNSQRTLLREDANNGKQKKAGNTESPFHIPFFGKSDKGTK